MSLNEQRWLITDPNYGKDECPAAAEPVISLATEAVAEGCPTGSSFVEGFGAGVIATAIVAFIAVRGSRKDNYMRTDASNLLV